MKQQRNTKQRKLVLDAVRARFDHPSADQIYLDVRTQDDNISRGTVYRNLNILFQTGEINQVKMPKSDRFESRLDKHYHLQCLECGELWDLPLDYNDDIDEQAAGKTGYIIHRHRTTFEGICPECQHKNTEQNE
ncbi:MAG: transcriptional repressor [Clostridiaceae bacterium]|nr:transcriptional repressor [Clostridiaceae bacterium]